MLTVVVANTPEIEALPADDPIVRALKSAGARTRQFDTPALLRATPLEHWLRQTFALDERSHPAAYARLLSNESPTADPTMLTVSPVHLRATMDHLVLHRPEALDITAAEANALIAAANDHFRNDGWVLSCDGSAHCWLLEVDEPLRVDLASSDAAHGRNIDHYMPSGPDGRRLRQLLNELQMLWFSHDVNAQREAHGAPTVNSLWVEGLALPLRGTTFEAVWSNVAAIRGLCRAQRTSPQPHDVPTNPNDLVASLRRGLTNQNILVVLDAVADKQAVDALLKAGERGQWPADSVLRIMQTASASELALAPAKKPLLNPLAWIRRVLEARQP